MGLDDRLARLLHEAPDEAEAVEQDGTWWTWGALRACATALDDMLIAARVCPGGRVGLVVRNRPEHVGVLLAVIATGRCVVAFDPFQPAARLAASIADADVAVVIGDAGSLAAEEVFAAAKADALVVELGEDAAVRVLGGAPPDCMPPPCGVTVEMLSSGTTGPPKRTGLTMRQLDQALAAASRTTPGEELLSPAVSLVATPMVHIGGLWGVLSSLHAGRKLVLMSRFEAQPWSEAVARHRIRATFLVPAALRDVLDAGIAPRALESVKLITSGATACPVDLADEFFRKYGIRVLTTYGATEFAGAVAGWTYDLHEQWWDRKMGSSGRAYGDVVLRVTDGEGTDLPPGEVGHLEVRTAQSARGPDEWVRTSDLAELDDDGFLWVEGRADDVIVRGGFKIQPRTVQRVLETHAAVREAAVVGMDDDRLGAVPVAAVELVPGAPRPTGDELVDLCRARLTAYEVPKHVLLLDRLPRTPSTKVSRVELLELVRAHITNGEEQP